MEGRRLGVGDFGIEVVFLVDGGWGGGERGLHGGGCGDGGGGSGNCVWWRWRCRWKGLGLLQSAKYSEEKAGLGSEIVWREHCGCFGSSLVNLLGWRKNT